MKQACVKLNTTRDEQSAVLTSLRPSGFIRPLKNIFVRMKILKLLVFLITCLGFLKPLEAQENNPKFDSALAARLGADDYGMKQYMLVILKTGDNKTTDKYFIDSCFSAHLRNIEKLT